MATVDLEWAALDKSLASKVVELLNKQLTAAKRPSFIGPIHVHSLDFGSVSPEVEVLDIQDIFKDFLEDDEDDLEDRPNNDLLNRNHTFEGRDIDLGGDDGNYEWVEGNHGQLGSAYPYQWGQHATGLSTPGLPHFQPSQGNGTYAANSSFESPMSGPPGISNTGAHISQQNNAFQVPPSLQHPDLQAHLLITHHSDLRLTLSTSLLVNHPSPAFMALPVKLSVTGLVFHGEVIVAYEGSRRRVHLCIVDDQDPSGPTRSRHIQEDEQPPSQSTKPLPIGQRLFPTIVIESEIGDSDKHVLKNVSRVERFIQDVIRKTIEEELVFPNFQTIILPERTL